MSGSKRPNIQYIDPREQQWQSEIRSFMDTVRGDTDEPSVPSCRLKQSANGITIAWRPVDEPGLTEYVVLKASTPNINQASNIGTVLQPVNKKEELQFLDQNGTKKDWYWVYSVKGNYNPKIRGSYTPPLNLEKQSIAGPTNPGNSGGGGGTQDRPGPPHINHYTGYSDLIILNFTWKKTNDLAVNRFFVYYGRSLEGDRSFQEFPFSSENMEIGESVTLSISIAPFLDGRVDAETQYVNMTAVTPSGLESNLSNTITAKVNTSTGPPTPPPGPVEPPGPNPPPPSKALPTPIVRIVPVRSFPERSVNVEVTTNSAQLTQNIATCLIQFVRSTTHWDKTGNGASLPSLAKPFLGDSAMIHTLTAHAGALVQADDYVAVRDPSFPWTLSIPHDIISYRADNGTWNLPRGASRDLGDGWMVFEKENSGQVFTKYVKQLTGGYEYDEGLDTSTWTETGKFNLADGQYWARACFVDQAGNMSSWGYSPVTQLDDKAFSTDSAAPDLSVMITAVVVTRIESYPKDDGGTGDDPIGHGSYNFYNEFDIGLAIDWSQPNTQSITQGQICISAGYAEPFHIAVDDLAGLPPFTFADPSNIKVDFPDTVSYYSFGANVFSKGGNTDPTFVGSTLLDINFKRKIAWRVKNLYGWSRWYVEQLDDYYQADSGFNNNDLFGVPVINAFTVSFEPGGEGGDSVQDVTLQVSMSKPANAFGVEFEGHSGSFNPLSGFTVNETASGYRPMKSGGVNYASHDDSGTPTGSTLTSSVGSRTFTISTTLAVTSNQFVGKALVVGRYGDTNLQGLFNYLIESHTTKGAGAGTFTLVVLEKQNLPTNGLQDYWGIRDVGSFEVVDIYRWKPLGVLNKTDPIITNSTVKFTYDSPIDTLIGYRWRCRANNKYGTSAWFYANGSTGTATPSGATIKTGLAIDSGDLVAGLKAANTSVTFSVNDYRTLQMFAGMITYSDGSSESITGWDTDQIGPTYIKTGSTDATYWVYYQQTDGYLRWSTTYSDAVGDYTHLVGMFVTTSDTTEMASWVPYIAATGPIISANQMAVNKLSSITIIVGALQAGELYGSKISTAGTVAGGEGTGARITLDGASGGTNSFRTHDSSNVKRIEIPTSSDRIEFFNTSGSKVGSVYGSATATDGMTVEAYKNPGLLPLEWVRTGVAQDGTQGSWYARANYDATTYSKVDLVTDSAGEDYFDVVINLLGPRFRLGTVDTTLNYGSGNLKITKSNGAIASATASKILYYDAATFIVTQGDPPSGVTGPVSSTTNSIARFSDTSGDVLTDCGANLTWNGTRLLLGQASTDSTAKLVVSQTMEVTDSGTSNASTLLIDVGGGESAIKSHRTGAGTYNPLGLYTNNARRMFINTAGEIFFDTLSSAATAEVMFFNASTKKVTYATAFPASSTDNTVALFSGTTGKVIKQATGLTYASNTLTNTSGFTISAAGTINLNSTNSGSNINLTTIGLGGDILLDAASLLTLDGGAGVYLKTGGSLIANSYETNMLYYGATGQVKYDTSPLLAFRVTSTTTTGGTDTGTDPTPDGYMTISDGVTTRYIKWYSTA